jgi:hypothetical protein
VLLSLLALGQRDEQRISQVSLQQAWMKALLCP